MHEGVERLALHGAQPDDAHAAMEFFAQRHERVAVEHGHLMAACRQTRPELLVKRLEAAVARRNASRAEQGDLQ